jgi:hypothetical protein
MTLPERNREKRERERKRVRVMVNDTASTIVNTAVKGSYSNPNLITTNNNNS